MADAMTGLMDQLDSRLKKKGLNTTREGNNVTVQGVKKSEPKAAPKSAPKDKQSESSKQEQENERLDKKQEDEYKKYQEGEKTRLKDQGSSFFKKGGKVSSASKRADGCATKGKTKGKML